ncbi:MAG: TlpA family protein disulfide reductase [Candidatus Thorarchaeota archaeon]|jgi:thiol-disulfide isomerase/thioredoxin
MKANLDDIRTRATSVRGYIESLPGKDQDILMETYEEYNLDTHVVEELKDELKDLSVVIFSAAWCGDCKTAMPVMLHLEEKLGLEVLVFGTIKTAPLDPKMKWAVPPSPPETNEWGVTAIPYFFFFNREGEQVAILIEKPTVKDTLEAEILHVLRNK